MQGCRRWGSIPGSSALGGREVGLYPRNVKGSDARQRPQALSPSPATQVWESRPQAPALCNKWPPPAGRAEGGGVRRYPVSPPAGPALSRAVATPPLSRPALRLWGKMAAEKQVPGGGGGGGGSGGGSGGGRGAGGEENKENERPSAGSKGNKEFGDSLSLESILE